MKQFEKYADLILEAGIGLQEGQNLVIQTEPYHGPFAYMLERMAYEKGARIVNVEIISPNSKLNRANFSRKEHLDYLPSYLKHKYNSYAEEEWALIYIGGLEDPDALKNLNQTNFSVMHRSVMPLLKEMIMARSDGRCTWNISNLPTPNWARSIWPEEAKSSSDDELCERLWNEMIPILRLDTPDPISTWRENSQLIHNRAGVLNQFKADHLHFEGPGTDLKVYLTQYSKFIGGGQKGKLGQQYFPNLPTEEFFTTPDYRKTTGKVKITRPVNVLGNNVDGAWFEFRDGAVVDYGADKNKDRLDAFFELDPKARFLGEVALVDCSSPIFKSGLVFNDILYDENAACHIAFGRGIAMAFTDFKGKTAEELDELGCNNSTLHTDFMIGWEELNVKAVSKSGDELQVIKKGCFVI